MWMEIKSREKIKQMELATIKYTSEWLWSSSGRNVGANSNLQTNKKHEKP